MSKITPFYELKNGDYEKLNDIITQGSVKYPAYVYDEKAQRLIHINEDGTYTYIQGAPTIYVTLTGTAEEPVNVSSLPDNMYILDGYYTVDGVEGVKRTTAPTMLFISTVDGVQRITSFSSGVTTYTNDGEETTVSTTVNTPVTSNDPGNTSPEIVEPAPDDFIDSLFEGLFNEDNEEGEG